MTDPEILRGCRNGNPRAWAALVDRYGPMLLRALEVRFGPGRDAEDVLQETWVRLLEGSGRRLSGIDPDRPLGPYLVTVALNLARRRPPRPLPLLGGEPASEPGTPEGLDQISGAMEALSPRDRLLLTLLEVDGVPYRQAAQALGVSPQSVFTLLARARGRLKARVEKALE